ncbi:MAG TPA: MnhB domain-containing protein [Bryobacteraceae bacterium]|jgi:multicomponent Na+:H+ antiporter subunit B|nr:MnhB domain-containing protein [Bryobacteraceae bacterium]
MTRKVRRVFILISAAALAWVFFLAYRPLPPLGFVHSQYGDLVNAITVPERHITDAVSAVNFDVRAFDTLGEEFILFTSVMGVLVLMRRQSDEPAGHHEDKAPGRTVPPASDAVRVTALLLVAPAMLFGLYIVVHGQVSPGGGFQGGVILASAPVLVYLCSEYAEFRRVLSMRLAEVSEAAGAATYILMGLVSLGLGGMFLENLLPLGRSGTLTSGGMVPFIDVGVGLEVGGGLSLALLAYLEELVEEKEQ